MKGDFTRFSHDPTKAYTGVYMQQGRALVDADWNELVEIQRRLDQLGAEDAVGPAAFPALRPGFGLVADGATLRIGAGRAWLGGLPVENPAPTTLGEQELPFDASALPNGDYLALLEAREEGVSVHEDPGVREVALRGADTATRSRVVWQVRLRPDSAVALTVPDLSPAGRDAAVRGGRCEAAGLNAAGTAEVALPLNLSSEADFTLEIRSEALSGPVLSLGALRLSAAADGLSLSLGASSVRVSANPARASELALVWSASAQTATLFRDGAKLGQLVRPGTFSGAPSLLRSADGAATGWLARVRLWARALREAELAPPRENAAGADCVGLWRFQDEPLRPWELPGFDPEASDAALAARVDARSASSVQNRLVRVEARRDAGQARLMWSRDNGVSVLQVEPRLVPEVVEGETLHRLTLAESRDDAPLPEPGQYVELIDDRSAFADQRPLAQVIRLEAGSLLLRGAPAWSPDEGARVRVWHGLADWDTVHPVELEEGLTLRCAGQAPRPGDWWTIPTRAQTGAALWPTDDSGAPIATPPRGPRRRFAALGRVSLQSGRFSVLEDLRVRVARAGEGRVRRAGDTLSGPLRVGDTLAVRDSAQIGDDLRVDGDLSVGGTAQLDGALLAVMGADPRLGVGISTPRGTLDVRGKAFIDAQQSGKITQGPQLTLALGGADTGLSWAGVGKLDVQVDGNPGLRIRNGRLGVGNAEPADTLSLPGDGASAAFGVDATGASPNAGRVAHNRLASGGLEIIGSGSPRKLSIYAESSLTLHAPTTQIVGNTPTLTFQDVTEGKLLWRSKANPGSDLGFLLFKDNSSFFMSGVENVRLSLGVFNDFGNAASDALDIQGGAQLTLNAGAWDAELNTAIGTPASGDGLRGISFRIHNVEKMVLDKNGRLGLGGDPQESARLWIAGAGRNLHIAGDVVLKDNDATNLIRFGKSPNYETDFQVLFKAKGLFNRPSLGIHVDKDHEFAVYSTSWTPLFAVQGGTGTVWLRGDLAVDSALIRLGQNTDKSGDKNAGAIGYRAFTNGLDIVGATDPGGDAFTRRISIHTQGGMTVWGSPTWAAGAQTHTYGPATSVKHIWKSMANPASDLGFLLFKDNSNFLGSGTENTRLSLGVFNDFGHAAVGQGDAMDLQGGTRLVMNAGSWDSELNSEIGTPSVGSFVEGLSFRIHNDEKLRIDKDGIVGVRTSLDLGYGRTRADTVAGVIAYRRWTDGLDIVGATSPTGDAYTRHTTFHSQGGLTFYGSPTWGLPTQLHVHGPATDVKHVWKSAANPTSDLAYLWFKDNSTFLVSGSENVRLSIGVANDFGGTAEFLDAMDLQGGAQLTLNAGTWDAELNGAIGPVGTGSFLRGISFRINNTEQMRLDKDGRLGIGTLSPESHKVAIGGEGYNLHIASDINLSDKVVYNLLRFGNSATGDYQFLHHSSGMWTRPTLGIHTHTNHAFGVYSSGWTGLFGVQGGTGNTWIRGQLEVLGGVKFGDGTIQTQAVKLAQGEWNFGESRFHDGGEMRRSIEITIAGWTTVVGVVVSIGMLDVDERWNTRFSTWWEALGGNKFKIWGMTWADTDIFQARVHYIAWGY